MFNIYYCFAGWMPISFGEKKVVPSYTEHNVRDLFFLSYIDDVKGELDNLFDFSKGQFPIYKEYEFDLEGENLKITTNVDMFKNNPNIKIKCEYIYSEEEEVYTYEFNYKEFLNNYIAEWKSHIEEYKKDFVYDEPDYDVYGEHWGNIRKLAEGSELDTWGPTEEQIKKMQNTLELQEREKVESAMKNL